MTEDSSNTPLTSIDSARGHQTKNTEKKPKKTSWFLLLLFLATLAALGMGGTSLWQMHQLLSLAPAKEASLKNKLSQLQEQNVTLKSLVAQLQDSQAALQESNQSLLKQNTEALSAQIQELEDHFKALEKKQQQRVRLNYNHSSENAVLEALSVAYRKLNFERDVQGTIALLELVIDTHCQPPGKPALIPVCQGLETDRAALTHVPVPNLFRILQEISTIQKHLSVAKEGGSQFESETAPSDVATQPTRTASELTSWSQRWVYMVDQLGAFFEKHFVRVHRLEEDQASTLTLTQRHFLIQNLQLLLEQAKSAAIRQNQQLYEHSLNQAVQAYQQYLAKGRDTRNYVALITNLSQIKLSPPVPKLSATYAALNAVGQAPKAQPGPKSIEAQPSTTVRQGETAPL